MNQEQRQSIIEQWLTSGERLSRHQEYFIERKYEEAHTAFRQLYYHIEELDISNIEKYGRTLRKCSANDSNKDFKFAISNFIALTADLFGENMSSKQENVTFMKQEGTLPCEPKVKPKPTPRPQPQPTPRPEPYTYTPPQEPKSGKNCMIRFILIVLIAVGFISMIVALINKSADSSDKSPVQATQTQQTTYYCTAKSGVNVRYTPSANSSVVGKLKYGQAVTVYLHETGPKFTKIEFKHSKGKTAWVSTQYLSPTKPATQASSSTASKSTSKTTTKAESSSATKTNTTKASTPSNSSTASTTSSSATTTTIKMHNGHEYVDLGLSVKWATCNIGAYKPEDYGGYFAWGERTPKDTYDWISYKWCKGSSGTFTKYNDMDGSGRVDNKRTLDYEDDAARAYRGGSWRMPTDAEWTELRTKCTWTYTTQKGVKGYKVTSNRNGNSIFLPAAGHRVNSNIYYENSYGYYWSSSLYANLPENGVTIDFTSTLVHGSSCYRCCGLSIRPVCQPSSSSTTTASASSSTSSKTSSSATTTPTKGMHNGHEYVDLGLSVKWATCNIGANDYPTRTGGYYAYGETKTKNNYTWDTYQHGKGSSQIYKYNNDRRLGTVDNKTTLDLVDDAARQNWGGNWRIPTKYEIEELITKCNWQWTTVGGTYGYKVTSTVNANYIFLPGCSYKSFSSRADNSPYGNYMSSTLSQDNLNMYKLGFNPGGKPLCNTYSRVFGYTIRPVYK